MNRRRGGLEHHRSSGLGEAVQQASAMLQGAYAIACIAEEAPNELVTVRRGSAPLVIGFGRGEMFLASDIPALLRETREVLVLEDGELALLKRSHIAIRRLDGGSVQRARSTVEWDAEAAEKGGYPHFMLKEIFEQPDVIRNTAAAPLRV